jgi:Protein of unknown function (DUF3318)
MRNREIDRLKSLVPDPWQWAIEIAPSTDINSPAIVTQRIANRRYLISIDRLRWYTLDLDTRNLLFWHEIAHIQNGTIENPRSSYITLMMGLGIALIDLPIQNIGILAAALLIAGLAAFRLYQKSLGEGNLQDLTTADRDAIALAVEFGYDRATATKLMTAAIVTLRKQTKNKLMRDRYATRLQVLSIAK